MKGSQRISAAWPEAEPEWEYISMDTNGYKLRWAHIQTNHLNETMEVMPGNRLNCEFVDLVVECKKKKLILCFTEYLLSAKLQSYIDH